LPPKPNLKFPLGILIPVVVRNPERAAGVRVEWGILDTGAQRSCVAESVAMQLDLRTAGVSKMNSGIQGVAQDCPIYSVDLGLRDLPTVRSARLAVGHPYLDQLGVGALVGHDILCRCRVGFDGKEWVISPLP